MTSLLEHVDKIFNFKKYAKINICELNINFSIARRADLNLVKQIIKNQIIKNQDDIIEITSKKNFFNCVCLKYKNLKIRIFNNCVFTYGIKNKIEFLQIIYKLCNLKILDIGNIVKSSVNIFSMSSQCNFCIDLKKMYELLLNNNVAYDPLTFAGLILKLDCGNVVIFKTGRMLLTSAEIQNTYNFICDNINTNAIKIEQK